MSDPKMSQVEWPRIGNYIGSVCDASAGGVNGCDKEVGQAFEFLYSSYPARLYQELHRFYSDEVETILDRDPVCNNVLKCYQEGYTKDIEWPTEDIAQEQHSWKFKDGGYSWS